MIYTGILLLCKTYGFKSDTAKHAKLIGYYTMLIHKKLPMF